MYDEKEKERERWRERERIIYKSFQDFSIWSPWILRRRHCLATAQRAEEMNPGGQVRWATDKTQHYSLLNNMYFLVRCLRILHQFDFYTIPPHSLWKTLYVTYESCALCLNNVHGMYESCACYVPRIWITSQEHSSFSNYNLYLTQRTFSRQTSILYHLIKSYFILTVICIFFITAFL